MNKAELIDAVALKTALRKSCIADVLDASADVLADALYVDGEVVLPGLGKLKTARRAERVGRNPQTGESIRIPERWVVRFSAGKALADVLNP